MGIFPERKDLRLPNAREAQYNMAEIDNLLQRSALNFRAQKDVLCDIPPRREDESLQIYLW
jgi:hypothetical protein